MRRPTGVSAVKECETEGERSLTDGGIVPMTQFMLECCTERRRKKERERDGGGTYVFGRPCAEHMFAVAVEIPRISQNKPVDRGPGVARLGSAPYITKAYTPLMPPYYYHKSVSGFISRPLCGGV